MNIESASEIYEALLSLKRVIELNRESGIQVFTNIPFNIDKNPIIMHIKCWVIDNGTNFNACPPN